LFTPCSASGFCARDAGACDRGGQIHPKFIKAEPSQAKRGPNFSKENALISLDFLRRIEPFQRVAPTPWAKNRFHRLLSLNPFALLDRRKRPPCLLRFLRGLTLMSPAR
jgi:hypothetical protein